MAGEKVTIKVFILGSEDENACKYQFYTKSKLSSLQKYQTLNNSKTLSSWMTKIGKEKFKPSKIKLLIEIKILAIHRNLYIINFIILIYNLQTQLILSFKNAKQLDNSMKKFTKK